MSLNFALSLSGPSEPSPMTTLFNGGVFRFFHFVNTEAPPPILATILIAGASLPAKTFKIALPHLFSADDWSYDFQKAGIAQRSAVVVRTPGDAGILFPPFVTVDAHNRQFVHHYPFGN